MLFPRWLGAGTVARFILPWRVVPTELRHAKPTRSEVQSLGDLVSLIPSGNSRAAFHEDELLLEVIRVLAKLQLNENGKLAVPFFIRCLNTVIAGPLLSFAVSRDSWSPEHHGQ
jgi:hypothetical protein